MIVNKHTKVTSAIGTSNKQSLNMTTNMDTYEDAVNMNAYEGVENTVQVQDSDEDAKDGVNGNLYDIYTTFNLDDERPDNTARSNSIIFRSKEFLTLIILILIILTSVIALKPATNGWPKTRPTLHIRLDESETYLLETLVNQTNTHSTINSQ